jgi:hypothetical protein
VSRVDGTLRAEGRPVGGQDVLVLSPAGDVLDGATSDDRGRFSVSATSADTVLGKVRTDAFGIALATGGAGDLDLHGPLATVDVTIESERGHPERLDLTLDPVGLDGVPGELMPFVRMKAPGVGEGHFGRRRLTEPHAVLRLQPGTWRINASAIDLDRADRPGGNAIAGAATAGDIPLAGGGPSGFLVDIGGDVRLTLVLREATSREL